MRVTSSPSAASASLGLVVVLVGHGLDVDDARPRLHLAGEEREVLAQRVALELARQVEVDEVRVADEGDAEHLPGLPLVPVGARRRPAIQLSIAEVVVGEVGLEREPEAPVGRSATRARTWKRVSPPA